MCHKRQLFATALFNNDCLGFPRPHYKSAAGIGLLLPQSGTAEAQMTDPACLLPACYARASLTAHACSKSTSSELLQTIAGSGMQNLVKASRISNLAVWSQIPSEPLQNLCGSEILQNLGGSGVICRPNPSQIEVALLCDVF